jgi:hypothetical protein
MSKGPSLVPGVETRLDQWRVVGANGLITSIDFRVARYTMAEGRKEFVNSVLGKMGV